MRVGRARRMLRPVEPDSSRNRGLEVARSAIELAPRSRLAARATAPRLTRAVKAKMANSGQASGEVKGWSCSTQPSGEAQRRQCSPIPASATSRSA